MTRFIRLIATLTLAAAVLFRFPSDYRMGVCVIVSVATTMLAFRCLFTGRSLLALLFLGIRGIFTPQRSQFSHVLISILDMATLALFAVSPLMLRKSTMTVVSSGPQGKL